MKPNRVVAALFTDEQGRFFAARRPDDKKQGGLWEFVGGKVDEGESDEAALIRECFEEMDCKVAVGDCYCELTHRYPDIVVTLALYRCEFLSPPRMLEHTGFLWLHPLEASDSNFCPADAPILAMLRNESGEKEPEDR
jgi:8-oxo-dGTP diphosphatase